MKSDFLIKSINYKDCYRLRLDVLKRKEWDYAFKYDGDDAPSTFHLGIFEGKELTTVASFYENRNELLLKLKQYQLRGMATSKSFQGRGFGRLIIEKSIEELKRRKTQVLWCNAREEAVNFYMKLGFEIIGPKFHISKVGPHFIMYLNIPS